MSYSQLEYHNWIFGSNYTIDPSESLTGITFMTNSGEPEYLNIKVPYKKDTVELFGTFEGSAVLSDLYGELILHTTEHSIIRFRPDTVINDKNNFDGNYNSIQFVSIVKVGNQIIRISTNSTSDQVGDTPNKLIQDLTFVVITENNGKLNISKKKIIKKEYGSEAITIIKDSYSESFYLLANDRIEEKYYLYKYDLDNNSFILKDTIKSKMRSNFKINGSKMTATLRGALKVSPNGKFIVSILEDTMSGVEVLSFDRKTEKLELVKTFDNLSAMGISLNYYSGDFSPNNEHFYMFGKNGICAITNFHSINDIGFIKLDVEYTGYKSYFQLAPNGKIYLVNLRKNYLSCLNNPNDINNIQYIDKVIDLHESPANWGFPNIPTTYYFQVSTDIDSMDICIGDEINIEIETLNEPIDAEYIWTDPNGNIYETKNLLIDSATRDMSGIFELSIKSVGYNLKRQVYVKVNGPLVELKTYRTSICTGDTNTIYIKNPYIKKVTASILWSTGDTTRGTLINAPGMYSVTVTDFDGCSVTESITIKDAKPEIDINPLLPTIFCEGDSTILEVTPYDNSSTYTWSNGEQGKQITVKTGGTYSVRVLEGENCRDTAFIEVKVNENLDPDIKGTKLCSGQSATLTAQPNDPSYTYLWSNGEATPVIVVSQAGTYSVTVSKAGCVGTTETTVKESPTPTFEILGQKKICNNETATLTSDKDFAEYLWSTNEITKEIEVTEAGTYTLTVTDENGCSATETYNVEKYELNFDISKGNIDFGKVYITETKSDNTTITNNSGFDITLDNGQIIADGEAYPYNYDFVPTQLGPFSNSIDISIIAPCDTVITIPITATVYARTTISTTDIYTQIGQTETVPVYLECEADLPTQDYSITTDIDRTAFFTNDSYTINQTQAINKNRTNIHNMTGTILLSNSLEYDITFPNYSFTNPYIEVIEQPGKIYIDSVCVFPLRNITTFDPTTLDISPNPASEQLSIDITTGVQGTMKLELVDTDGRVIYTDEWTQSTRTKQMQINTMNIPSGLYQVRLITPYDAITKSVIVVE